MLTPKFKIDQDDYTITVTVWAPYANMCTGEMIVQDNEIRFYVSPYYLRLFLPHQLVDSEENNEILQDGKLLETKSNYNFDEGTYVLTALKESKGQHFPRLSMLTSILTPHSKKKSPLVNLTDEEDSDSNDSMADDSVKEDEITPFYPYGFAEMKENVFTKLESEINLSIEVEKPDSKSVLQRRRERMDYESKEFAYQHYLYDFYKPEAKECLLFVPNFSPNNTLIDSENEQLLKLPTKKINIKSKAEHGVCLGLVDLLLSYCYNHRIHTGDECVRASWNYAKVSATLSWLDVFESEEEVVYAFLRRSLCFPLYRNWDVSCQVIKDTIRLLTAGRTQVLKCLLEMHNVFRKCEKRYILNELFITEYCCWIQTVPDQLFLQLTTELQKVKLEKDLVGLHLTLWEKISSETDENYPNDNSADSDDENTDLESESNSDTEDSNNDISETVSESSSDTEDSDISEFVNLKIHSTESNDSINHASEYEDLKCEGILMKNCEDSKSKNNRRSSIVIDSEREHTLRDSETDSNIIDSDDSICD